MQWRIRPPCGLLGAPQRDQEDPSGDQRLPSLTRAASKAKREDACPIALLGGPTSPEAQRLVQTLMDDVVLPYRLTLGHSKNAGGATISKLTTAAEALLADLCSLTRARSSSGSRVAGAHGMSRSSFSSKGHLGFGYDIFSQVVRALEGEGLLTRKTGYPKWGAPPGERTGTATCFNLTEKMIELAVTHEVLLDDWSDHWTLKTSRGATVGRPVILLRAKRKTIKGEKQPAKSLPVDWSNARVQAIEEQMQRINAYLQSQKIDGLAFTGLRRIFNNGDQEDFDWNKGGRFYSMADGQSYERWPARYREALLTINDEPTTEVDLRASHLTLLHALTGEKFDPSDDPYHIEEYPRIIVKLWVAQAIGSSNPRPSQWSKKSKADYEEERPGCDLQVDFPCREVGAAVKNKHSLLVDLGFLRLSTLDLQYHEAEILRRAMEKLMFERGIPALPIHDALIVPQSFAGGAEDCLKLAFEEHVEDVTGDGCLVVPNVTLKGS